MNRGNSGGPTFNMDGQVIGINTAILSTSGGSIGIGFAIPSSVAKPVIEQLKARGTVERGWLGIQIQRLTPEIAKSLGREEPQGALVAAVTADSPAAKAGVRQGDIVLAFAGKKIAEPHDLSLAVATAPIGKEASLTVWRDGKELELHSVIGLMPKSVETARGEEPSEEPSVHKHSALGLRFAPLTDEARQEFDIPRGVHGVVVADVAPDSPAAREIEPGDVIVSINQRPVSAPSEAADEQSHLSSRAVSAFMRACAWPGCPRDRRKPTERPRGDRERNHAPGDLRDGSGWASVGAQLRSPGRPQGRLRARPAIRA